MATQTTNIGLTKPAGTDNVSRQVINDNYDIIDEEFGKRKPILYTDYYQEVDASGFHMERETGEVVGVIDITNSAIATAQGITIDKILCVELRTISGLTSACHFMTSINPAFITLVFTKVDSSASSLGSHENIYLRILYQ